MTVYWNTVEPGNEDRSWDQKCLVFLDRWSWFSGHFNKRYEEFVLNIGGLRRPMVVVYRGFRFKVSLYWIDWLIPFKYPNKIFEGWIKTLPIWVMTICVKVKGTSVDVIRVSVHVRDMRHIHVHPVRLFVEITSIVHFL